MSVGYTAKQAERLKHRLDVGMAKIEDDIAALASILTDTNRASWLGQQQLEDLRAEVTELKAIVDRRTRSEVRS